MDRCPCPVFYNGSVAGSVTGSVRIGRIGAGVRAACSEACRAEGDQASGAHGLQTEDLANVSRLSPAQNMFGRRI